MPVTIEISQGNQGHETANIQKNSCPQRAVPGVQEYTNIVLNAITGYNVKFAVAIEIADCRSHLPITNTTKKEYKSTKKRPHRIHLLWPALKFYIRQ